MEPVRVVVAEDNPETRESLVEKLAHWPQIQVVGAACNGVEAMRMVHEQTPHVLICGMIMPQLDGFGVLEHISRMAADHRPKVIALTALNRGDFISRAIGLGASYYMLKPADTAFLVQQIMKLAGRDTVFFDRYDNREETREQKVAGLLLRAGVPAHLNGYRFLLQALMLVMEKPEYLSSITRRLYPEVARCFDTMASCVERSIRHAITITWDRGGAVAIERLFKREMFSGNEKPTNCELIALLFEWMRMQGWVRG